VNVQKLFEAVQSDPDQSTLLVVVQELERQRYEVIVDRRYRGSREVARAEESGELNRLPLSLGVPIHIRKGNEEESFRLHFLDLDAIAITPLVSPPVIYNPDFTINEFR
jgi:hypothetical protein